MNEFEIYLNYEGFSSKIMTRRACLNQDYFVFRWLIKQMATEFMLSC